MKERYIKQVKRELHLPRNVKKEVLRDLNEIFSSALEHGETEQQVAERLGTPRDFAKSTAEQFGVDNTAPRQQAEMASSFVLMLLAAVSFVIYAVATSGKAPKGAIGQADATTDIFIAGTFGFDILPIVLIIGVIAAALGAVQMIRVVRNKSNHLEK